MNGWANELGKRKRNEASETTFLMDAIMIAKTNHHYGDDELRGLLDERLSSEESREVESHLSGCSTCQRELKRIAGEEDWWKETVTVLSDSTFVPNGTPPGTDSAGSGSPDSSSNVDSVSVDRSSNQIAARSLDASVAWIRPLLAEPPAGSTGCIGQLDQYPIHGVIGQGGMGVVLRGTDLALNRPVAIKVLSPHLAGVGAARARFMREAQAAAAIVHPSIVPIYGVIQKGPLPYLVMPVIGGGNLQQRIDVEGPLELAEVLRIGAQIAEGLAAAHRGGVIHRDIKPANILVEEGNGRVLISDFGLARALDDATLTCSGMIAGTPQYMSPEQARGEAVDARSDLFSLGSLLYALATGRPPFRAETPLAVLRKITETRARHVQEVNEQFPAWFDVLIRHFMQVDLSRRVDSADKAAELLQEAHAHVRNPTAKQLPGFLRRGHGLNGLGQMRFLPSGKAMRQSIRWLLAASLMAVVGTALYQHQMNKPGKRTGIPVVEINRQDIALPAEATVQYAQSRPPIGGLPDQASGPLFDSGNRTLIWQDDASTFEIQALHRQLDSIGFTATTDWVSQSNVATKATKPLPSPANRDSQR